MHTYVCVCLYQTICLENRNSSHCFSLQSNKRFSLVLWVFFIYNVISPFPPIIFQNKCACAQSPVNSPSSNPTRLPHSQDIVFTQLSNQMVAAPTRQSPHLIPDLTVFQGKKKKKKGEGKLETICLLK